MTRKKLVKQLMGLGMTRNRANFHAELCRYKGIAYAEHYEAMAPWLRVKQAACKVAVTIGASVANFRANLMLVKNAAEKLAETVRGLAPNEQKREFIGRWHYEPDGQPAGPGGGQG